MFWTATKAELKELQGEYEKTLKALRTTKEELEDLKLKKRLEQEEIVHMQRINEEKMKMELDQEKATIAKQTAEQIVDFRKAQTEELLKMHKDLFSKLEERMNTEVGNLKEIYTALMARLPNVNLQLTKKI
jgi:hypothetical protein